MQNIWKSAFDIMLRHAGVFFRRQQWKEILIFIFFLLLSFIFWFMQILQQDYEQRIVLPIRYKNVPNEWVLSENNPNTINVLLKEKGINLLYYFWNPRFHAVDVSVLSLPVLSDSTVHLSNRMLESELSKQLIASTSIISFEPREIFIVYDTLCSRMKPVSAQVSLNMRQGFLLSESITISPSVVKLYGSQRTLDALHEVKTKRITLNDVAKTRELTTQLALPAGIKSDIESIKIVIPVEEFTEKKIQLQVKCLDIPANYVLRMFPSSVEITCNVPLSRFKELTAENVEIVMPFSRFQENQATGKMAISITRKPLWLTNPVLVPNELEFVIEHHD